MNRCYAVLMDTVSIQKYVFQSNKLKENLGASFLVEEVYKEYLNDAVSTVFKKKFDCNAWENEHSVIRIQKEPFEVGYIGGGNALLLFQEKGKAEEFIKEWTKSLLVNTPGIVTAAALNEFDVENFQESKANLFKILRENKSRYVPETLISRHGVTSECTHSGLSMDVWNSGESEYVSAATNAKIEASKLAQNDVHGKYKELLKDEFCFTNELEKLGGISGKDSHIAIVHIDGNSMGERFKKMNSLEKIRNLSKTVDTATRKAFSDLLSHIINNFKEIMESLGFDDNLKDERYKYPIDKKTKKKILPIRPIILGGDDVTFVCDGKLGIYFSKLFIEAFEQKDVSDGEKLTACAGVAIIKTKYPFYRGYQLAEELCKNAKKVRNDSHSYLDFHISTGGISGTLKEIREKYFKVAQGNLMYRPYKLTPKDSYDEHGFDLFVKNTGILRKFPRNKIHELRQSLTLSKASAEQFVQQMKYREKELPGITCQESLFKDSITPYFDMIELMEFYPDFVLEESEVAK